MFYMTRRKKPKSKASKIIGAVFAVLTVILFIFIIAAVWIQKEQLEKLRSRCTESVTGVCVQVTSQDKTRSVRKRRRNKSHSYASQDFYREYTSHIKYTVDGKDYQTQKVRENDPYPKEGGNITVYYDPNDPSVCYIP